MERYINQKQRKQHQPTRPSAKDIAVIHKEIGIDIIAGEDVPRAGGNGRFLAPVLRLRVELLEDHLAVCGGGRHADLAGGQLANLAVQLVAGLAEHKASVRAVDVDGLIIIGIDIALVVGEDGTDVSIAPALGIVRLLLGNGRDGAQQRTVRIKLNQFGDGIALRAVVRVAVGLAEEPDRAVRAGGDL